MTSGSRSSLRERSEHSQSLSYQGSADAGGRGTFAGTLSNHRASLEARPFTNCPCPGRDTERNLHSTPSIFARETCDCGLTEQPARSKNATDAKSRGGSVTNLFYSPLCSPLGPPPWPAPSTATAADTRSYQARERSQSLPIGKSKLSVAPEGICQKFRTAQGGIYR